MLILKGLAESVREEADVLPLNYSRNRSNDALRLRRNEIWCGAIGLGKDGMAMRAQRKEPPGAA